MYRLLFRSEMSRIWTYDSIKGMCQSSARRNRLCGVTGFMIECGGVFIQMIEGAPENVRHIFELICRDERHHKLQILLHGNETSQRYLGAWALNIMLLDDNHLWRSVIGSEVTFEEFLKKSNDASFALGLIMLAYRHACSVAQVDPLTQQKRGRIPLISQMLAG